MLLIMPETFLFEVINTIQYKIIICCDYGITYTPFDACSQPALSTFKQLS